MVKYRKDLAGAAAPKCLHWKCGAGEMETLRDAQARRSGGARTANWSPCESFEHHALPMKAQPWPGSTPVERQQNAPWQTENCRRSLWRTMFRVPTGWKRAPRCYRGISLTTEIRRPGRINPGLGRRFSRRRHLCCPIPTLPAPAESLGGRPE